MVGKWLVAHTKWRRCILQQNGSRNTAQPVE
jgi:hypothetical protein